MNSLARRLSYKKYREENYTKLLTPSKKNKVVKNVLYVRLIIIQTQSLIDFVTHVEEGQRV